MESPATRLMKYVMSINWNYPWKVIQFNEINWPVAAFSCAASPAAIFWRVLNMLLSPKDVVRLSESKRTDSPATTHRWPFFYAVLTAIMVVYSAIKSLMQIFCPRAYCSVRRNHFFKIWKNQIRLRRWQVAQYFIFNTKFTLLYSQ